MRKTRIQSNFIFLFLMILFLPGLSVAQTVGKWRRVVIDLPDPTFDEKDNNGNPISPFTWDVDVTFTHASGNQIKLPAYYAGSKVWKVGFMPTETGDWTYVVSFPNSPLDGQTGTIHCIASGDLGLLAGDPQHPKKWKYADGPYVVPIGVFIQIMHSTATIAELEALAGFLDNNNINLVNFRLCEHELCFKDENPSSLEMELTLWDRLEQRISILSDRGIGVDIMLYTDDGGRPRFSGQSVEEQLLVKYMVARFASFPSVMFNSGIDIWEFRGSNSSWHDWYGNLVKSLDPYGHPVSSRREAYGKVFMNVQTYNSLGHRNSDIDAMIDSYKEFDMPTANNDNFGEDRTGINGHTPDDIRRTAWKAVVSGGVGFHVRHNKTQDCAKGITSNCDNPFSVTGIEGQLDSEEWLSLVNPFVNSKLGPTFGLMENELSLVSNGYALADPGFTKILVLYMGPDDTWDPGSSGPLTLRLTGVSKNYNAIRWNTQTGIETSLGVLSGGQDHVISPPSQDDWVFLLEEVTAPPDTVSPRPPTNLQVK